MAESLEDSESALIRMTRIFESANNAPSVLVLGATSLPEPIQLGMGIELYRLGAVVGMNRRIDLDALRGSVGSGVVGKMLGDALIEHANELLPSLMAWDKNS